MTKVAIVPVYHPINSDRMGHMVIPVGENLRYYQNWRRVLQQLALNRELGDNLALGSTSTALREFGITDHYYAARFYDIDAQEITKLMPSPDAEYVVLDSIDEPTDESRVSRMVHISPNGVRWTVDEYRKSVMLTWEQIDGLIGVEN